MPTTQPISGAEAYARLDALTARMAPDGAELVREAVAEIVASYRQRSADTHHAEPYASAHRTIRGLYRWLHDHAPESADPSDPMVDGRCRYCRGSDVHTFTCWWASRQPTPGSQS